MYNIYVEITISTNVFNLEKRPQHLKGLVTRGLR